MSYNNAKKLLVPKSTSGSVQSVALAIKEPITDWKLEDKVVAMSFETSSNIANKYIKHVIFLRSNQRRNCYGTLYA